MTHNTLFGLLDKNKEGNIIKIKTDEITMLPELQNAFHMDKEVKDRITADMEINGFSKAHPIHIFMWEGKWVLCDGHTRFASAKDLNFKYVWAQVHIFESINQALLYSMKEQFNRRNIEDSELFKQYEILRKEEIDGRKLTATEMSERLKKSKRHIFKLQEVFSKSSKEQLNAIRNGQVSINQVYNDIKKQEQKVPKTESFSMPPQPLNPVEIVSEQQVEQTIQDELQKDLQKKHRDLQNKELELKQRETKLSQRLSDKKILLIGATWALVQIAKGKTPKEILSTDSFDDSINAASIHFEEKDMTFLNVN